MFFTFLFSVIYLHCIKFAFFQTLYKIAFHSFLFTMCTRSSAALHPTVYCALRFARSRNPGSPKFDAVEGTEK